MRCLCYALPCSTCTGEETTRLGVHNGNGLKMCTFIKVLLLILLLVGSKSWKERWWKTEMMQAHRHPDVYHRAPESGSVCVLQEDLVSTVGRSCFSWRTQVKAPVSANMCSAVVAWIQISSGHCSAADSYLLSSLVGLQTRRKFPHKDFKQTNKKNSTCIIMLYLRSVLFYIIDHVASSSAFEWRDVCQTFMIKVFLPLQAFPLGLIELHRSLSSIRLLSTTLLSCVFEDLWVWDPHWDQSCLQCSDTPKWHL